MCHITSSAVGHNPLLFTWLPDWASLPCCWGCSCLQGTRGQERPGPLPWRSTRGRLERLVALIKTCLFRHGKLEKKQFAASPAGLAINSVRVRSISWCLQCEQANVWHELGVCLHSSMSLPNPKQSNKLTPLPHHLRVPQSSSGFHTSRAKVEQHAEQGEAVSKANISR